MRKMFFREPIFEAGVDEPLPEPLDAPVAADVGA